MDFSETIVASDLKVGGYRQLIELMKIYSRSMSLPDLGQRLFTYAKLKPAFLRNHWAIFNQNEAHILFK